MNTGPYLCCRSVSWGHECSSTQVVAHWRWFGRYAIQSMTTLMARWLAEVNTQCRTKQCHLLTNQSHVTLHTVSQKYLASILLRQKQETFSHQDGNMAVTSNTATSWQPCLGWHVDDVCHIGNLAVCHVEQHFSKQLSHTQHLHNTVTTSRPHTDRLTIRSVH